MFNECKVAQMAAYLLAKDGGRFAHLKLMKLLYLVDRQCLKEFGFAMSGDDAVSMRHGPVLSQTLDLINGVVRSDPNGWEHWISDVENYEVAIKKEFSRNNLNELSEADIEILDAVWHEFGSMSKYQIRDYTHYNCPEWKDPNGSSIPISKTSIFKALGKSDEESIMLNSDIEIQKSISRLFAAL